MVKALVRTTRHEKVNKGIQIEKEEIKFSLFADDMVLFLRGSQSYSMKCLKITCCHQVAGYKIDLQNSGSLYQHKHNEKVSMATPPFIIALER